MVKDILDSEPISRKTLVIFYVIDVSRSMRGNKLRTVNSVMRNTVADIRDFGGSDVDLRIAAMSFSNECQWLYPKPVSVEEFQWKDLEAGGWTNLGAACRELNSKLSRSSFMSSPSLSYAPVIILLSDGGPTDDYQKAIYELGKNRWFKYALKIAIAIGTKANLQKLSVFTGGPDSVLKSNNSESLARLIKTVSIVSSQITSSYDPVDLQNPDESKQKELNKRLAEIVNDSDEIIESGWE